MIGDPDDEALRRLRRAVSRLPKLQREVFLAHRLDGLSYEQIARRTGLKASRVERHVASAIWKVDVLLSGRALRWWHRFL
ncbi:MAG TPA: sigma-70 region 4 domain-containing protein [Sphingomonadaceae bacterium]|nr:sigma-70 region 4 domain-containing protein [Sphingomonadaceae bacterium]